MSSKLEEVQARYGATKGADFKPEEIQRIPFSLSIEALEGAGKTAFCLLTCPLPIVYINVGDRSAMPFLYDLYESDRERYDQITHYDFQAPTVHGWDRIGAEKVLNGIAEIAQAELSDGKLRRGTFCLDSSSTWWDAAQTARVEPALEAQIAQFGKQIGGFAYEEGNKPVKGLVSWCKAQGAFVVLTHQMKQDWGSDGPIPGSFSPRMNSRIPGLVEIRLRLVKACAVCSSQACENEKHQGRKHFGRLIKFGKDTRAEGYMWENPTFDFLYQLYTNAALREGLFGAA